MAGSMIRSPNRIAARAVTSTTSGPASSVSRRRPLSRPTRAFTRASSSGIGEGLDDEVVRAALEAADPILLLGERGQEDDAHVGVAVAAVADAAAELEAGAVRQADVEQQRVGPEAPQRHRGLTQRPDRGHPVLVVAEVLAQEVADRDLVLDQQ